MANEHEHAHDQVQSHIERSSHLSAHSPLRLRNSQATQWMPDKWSLFSYYFQYDPVVMVAVQTKAQMNEPRWEMINCLAPRNARFNAVLGVKITLNNGLAVAHRHVGPIMDLPAFTQPRQRTYMLRRSPLQFFSSQPVVFQICPAESEYDYWTCSPTEWKCSIRIRELRLTQSSARAQTPPLTPNKLEGCAFHCPIYGVLHAVCPKISQKDPRSPFQTTNWRMSMGRA